MVCDWLHYCVDYQYTHTYLANAKINLDIIGLHNSSRSECVEQRKHSKDFECKHFRGIIMKD